MLITNLDSSDNRSQNVFEATMLNKQKDLYNEMYIRNKFTIISFILAVGIVYLHSKFQNCGGQFQFDEFHDFIIFILNTCVPLFFCISGYLFFRNFQFNKVTSKLKRRAKSLLIPYIIWNIGYVAFMYIAYKTGLMHDSVMSDSPLELTKAVINSECSPLWFVRYLMIFICIAPLAYFILRYRVIGGLVIICMIIFNIYNYQQGAFANCIDVNANTLVMFNYQFIYYAIGAYAALCWSSQIEKPTRRKSTIALVGVLFMIVIYWVFLRHNGTVITNHTYRIIWIPLFWFAFDILPKIKVQPWMQYSFFI